MALTVALIFKKKNKSAPDLNLELLSTKDTLHTKNDNISWKNLSKGMMYYLISILAEVFEEEGPMEELSYVKLTQDHIDKFIEITSKQNNLFFGEFLLAYEEFDNYSISILLIDKEDILDRLAHYDISKHDFSDSFMLIESLESEFDLTFLQASRLLIHMNNYG